MRLYHPRAYSDWWWALVAAGLAVCVAGLSSAWWKVLFRHRRWYQTPLGRAMRGGCILFCYTCGWMLVIQGCMMLVQHVERCSPSYAYGRDYTDMFGQLWPMILGTGIYIRTFVGSPHLWQARLDSGVWVGTPRGRAPLMLHRRMVLVIGTLLVLLGTFLFVAWSVRAFFAGNRVPGTYPSLLPVELPTRLLGPQHSTQRLLRPLQGAFTALRTVCSIMHA